MRRFKYAGASHLARPLAELMLGPARELPPADLVVPVPLHPRRLRQRGYNQSALLAAEIGPVLGQPVAFRALKRLRDGQSQASLGREERLRNLRTVFEAHRARELRDLRVLLVDDVMTTGATAAACTEALLRAGAGQVVVLTLARAVP